MAWKYLSVAFLLTAPLQASEWSIGVDVPPDQGGLSLWRTGEKWGNGFTIGGPNVQLGGCCDDANLYYASGSLTIQRHLRNFFFFGEIGLKSRERDVFHEEHGVHIRMKIGAGISRKYKDLAVFL